MKIAVVHQFYLPPESPGGTRFNDFARVWKGEGHDVRVFASSVAYTSGLRDPDTSFPWRREREAGVEVVRSWTNQHPDGALSSRIVSMLGFGLGTAGAALLSTFRPDVVLATSPTLAAYLPGMLAASRWRCPLVLEVRDLWPESLVSLGTFAPDGVVTRAAYGFEEAAYELADAVVALTPGIAGRLLERGAVERDRLVVLPNGVDLERHPIVDRREARARVGWDHDRFVALYAGAHGYANDLGQLLDVAERLRDADQLDLVAIGDGPRKQALVADARCRGLHNLRWLDPVDREELDAYLAAADAGMVFLRDTPVFRTVYPNKMFDYMAAARPTVLGMTGAAAEVLEEHDAGIVVPPERPEAYARALLDLAVDPDAAAAMGARGRRAVEQHFDRRKHALRYLDLFRGL